MSDSHVGEGGPIEDDVVKGWVDETEVLSDKEREEIERLETDVIPILFMPCQSKFPLPPI